MGHTSQPAGSDVSRLCRTPLAVRSLTHITEDVLTGFVDAEDDALGRPVGVAVDQAGALLVAVDVGNVIWRVKSAASTQ